MSTFLYKYNLKKNRIINITVIKLLLHFTYNYLTPILFYFQECFCAQLSCCDLIISLVDQWSQSKSKSNQSLELIKLELELLVFMSLWVVYYVARSCVCKKCKCKMQQKQCHPGWIGINWNFVFHHLTKSCWETWTRLKHDSQTEVSKKIIIFFNTI